MKKNFYLMLFCLLFFSSCEEKTQTQQSEKYKTLIVKKSDPIIYTDYAAVLKGCQSVEIRPQVSGIITKICINEGEMVHQGQVLFIIDQVPYKAALATAEAKVRKAEAQQRTSQLTLESKQQLHREKIISDFDLQTAENEYYEAEAQVSQAKAEALNAKNNLSYTEVKSPVNGVASMIPYRVGALVNCNIAQPLVTVSDDTHIHAYFSMPENGMLDILQQYGSTEEALKQLPEVTLTMSNGTPYAETGRIDAISGTVDKNTGVISLRAVFPNPKHLLRNGSTGSLSIPSVHKNCVVIPQSATYELQDRVFAWKVINGQTKSTPLTLFKHNDGQHYIVLSGLTTGDTIIAEGAGLVREGTLVNANTPSN